MDNISIPTLQEFIAFGRNVHFARSNRYYVQMGLPQALVGQVSSEDIRNANMLCEEAAFPGSVINTRTLRINGLNEQRAVGRDYMGDEINFQFLSDLGWKTRDLFDAWMEACAGPHYFREVSFYNDYVAPIEIYALAPIRTAVPRFIAMGFNANDIKNIAYKFIGTTPISNDIKKIVGKVVNKSKPVAEAAEIIDELGGDDRAEIPVWGMRLVEAWPRMLNVQQLSYSQEDYLRLNMTFTFKYWEKIYVNETGPEPVSLRERIEDTVKGQILNKTQLPNIRALPAIRSSIADVTSLIPKF